MYHIYREEYLNRVDEFKREGFKYDMCQTYIPEPPSTETRMQRLGREIRKFTDYIDRKTFAKLRAKKQPRLRFTRKPADNTVVLLMAVRNGSVQYLRDALLSVTDAANFVLLADATANGLDVQLCETLLQPGKYEIIRTDSVSALWPKAGEHGAHWVLAMEADEVLQAGGAEAIRHLVDNVFVDAYFFRRYAMWNPEEYREDAAEHTGHVPYLMRYQKEYPFGRNDSQSLPVEAATVVHANMNIKVRCYRWTEKTIALEDGRPVLKQYSDLPDEI